jgi:hypothetical protein
LRFHSTSEGVINPPQNKTSGGIHISAKPAAVSVHHSNVFSPISSSNQILEAVSSKRNIVYSPRDYNSDNAGASSPAESRNIFSSPSQIIISPMFGSSHAWAKPSPFRPEFQEPYRSQSVSPASMPETQISSDSRLVQRNLFASSCEGSAQFKFQENPSNEAKICSASEKQKVPSEAPMVVLLGGPVITSRPAPSLS